MKILLVIILVILLLGNMFLLYRLDSVLERLELTLTDVDMIYSKSQQMIRDIKVFIDSL